MPALLALAAVLSALVELATPLQTWRTEIQQTGIRVFFARVHTDTDRNEIVLPADAPERPLFAAMLAQPSFVEQFVHAHALTVNLRGTSLVFLNMRRAAEWEGHEDALLAHELAHIALKGRGYDSVRAPGLAPCQITHATNVVQHVLLRRELRARAIDDAPFRARALEAAAGALSTAAPAESSACEQARRVEMWVDAALGLSEEQWPRQAEFLRTLRTNWPQLEPAAQRLIGHLSATDVSEKPAYEAALTFAAETLRQLK